MREGQRGRAQKAAKQRPQTEEPGHRKLAAGPSETAASPDVGSDLDVGEFRRRLMHWYAANARTLPWRGLSDPYRIWVSEVMLQQTRVAAVIDHYQRFLSQFPTLLSLALASEAEVLAAWSGLGYYRRARMLHKASQFITQELAGTMPRTAASLKTLPGIGEYTCAAIASIAFGESIPVLDGNVERVLLRVLGLAQTSTVEGRGVLQRVAQALIPLARAPGNAPGDHNQAMMELGATLCLPRSPLCLNCPVLPLCRTRGEHITQRREAQKSRAIAYLLKVRSAEMETEVLLQKRPADASLMPDMYELPALPEDAVREREPIFRTRHSITSTNFHVSVFTDRHEEAIPDTSLTSKIPSLISNIPVQDTSLRWIAAGKLPLLPLTGLARKVLQRLKIMAISSTELTPSSQPD